jgi:hypothetical protein
MCRLLFFTALLLLFSFFNNVTGQDIIVKINGDEIKTKIVQVSDTLVKYKNFDDPEFTTFLMPSSEIKMIKFENGKRKIFGIDLAQSYIGFIVANSRPTGDYSSSDGSRSNQAQGFAENGRYIGIDGCFYFKNKKWGLGFDLSSFSHTYNSSSMDASFKTNLNPNETVTTTFGRNYKGEWFAIGPQYSSKIGRLLTWDIRYSLGIMGMSKPSFQYNNNNKNSSSITYNSSGGFGTSLVRTFSTGLRLHLTKKIALKLFLQYAASNPIVKFKTDFQQTDSTGTIIFSEHDSPHKKLIHFNALNIGIGLTYQFGGLRIKPDKRKMYGKFSPSYFGIMFESSAPIASYGTSGKHNNPGLAKHGEGFNLDACRYFKEKKWGIGFEMAGFKNSFDEEEIDQILKINSVGSVNTTYGNYKGGWLTAGPQLSLKRKRWVYWDLRASLGIMGLSKPSFHYVSYDGSNNKVDYFLNSGLGISLVKSVTTGFRFFLTDKLALRMFGQFAASNTTVNFKAFLTETDSAGNVIISENTNHKKQVSYSALNTGIGLTYLFGKK